MYACIHLAGAAGPESLLDLAYEFSPHVEQTDRETVLFNIGPLRKMLGSPYQIAAEISRAGYERKWTGARLAIAANADTAVLLARHYAGVTLVAAGEEPAKLAALPLIALPMEEPLLHILLRWGLKTCGDLAALPEAGVAERLGPSGVYLRKLALGVLHRPLRIPAAVSNFERRQELEHTIDILEPLLFLLSGTLAELCSLLRSQARAARQLATQLDLEDAPPYRATLEFPIPLTDNRTMLKLLQLHLERHPPAAPIKAFSLRVDPVEPKRMQGGIFMPPAPLPDKWQVTLARIAGMVGEENVGAPELLDTHRPDAFRLTELNIRPRHPAAEEAAGEELRLAIRLFRPALEARVRLVECVPKDVAARQIRGKVLHWAGPWKTSGEWWASTAWSREEWDVALDDGGLYRIYRQEETRWFVQGVYD